MHYPQTAWRKLRIEAGLSIRQLQARSGIHRGRLSMIERGLPPSPTEAAAILAAVQKAEGPEATTPLSG